MMYDYTTFLKTITPRVFFIFCLFFQSLSFASGKCPRCGNDCIQEGAFYNVCEQCLYYSHKFKRSVAEALVLGGAGGLAFGAGIATAPWTLAGCVAVKLAHYFAPHEVKRHSFIQGAINKTEEVKDYVTGFYENSRGISARGDKFILNQQFIEILGADDLNDKCEIKSFEEGWGDITTLSQAILNECELFPDLLHWYYVLAGLGDGQEGSKPALLQELRQGYMNGSLFSKNTCVALGHVRAAKELPKSFPDFSEPSQSLKKAVNGFSSDRVRYGELDFLSKLKDIVDVMDAQNVIVFDIYYFRVIGSIQCIEKNSKYRLYIPLFGLDKYLEINDASSVAGIVNDIVTHFAEKVAHLTLPYIATSASKDD